MLCCSGETGSLYVAMPFFFRDSNATSSATVNYVAVQERLGESEEQASRNVEQTRKEPTFVPKKNWLMLSFFTSNQDFPSIIFYSFTADDFYHISV